MSPLPDRPLAARRRRHGNRASEGNPYNKEPHRRRVAGADPTRERGVFTLYVITFLFTLMMGTGLPLVPQFLKEDLGATILFIGIVGGVYGIMQVVLRLPMGDLSDQVGRRRGLTAAFVFAFAGGILFVWSPVKEVLIPAQALFGFASGIYWVSANSYIGDTVHPDRIPRVMSNYSAALGIGLLVGPPMGGLLADAYGFRAGLVVFPVASALSLILLFTSFPADGPLGKIRIRGRRVYQRTWTLIRIPDLAFSAAGIATVAIIFAMYSNFYPLWVKGLGFSSFIVGILFATREILATGIRFAAPRALVHMGPRRVLTLGILLGAGSVVVMPWLTSLPLLVVFALLGGIGTGVIIPANLVLINRSAPAGERGLANGIYGTALGVGSAVAPLGFGWVADKAGLAPAFVGAGILGMVAAVALWFLRHAATAGPRDGAEPAAP